MKSLGDCIVDRTESLDIEAIKEYFVDKEEGKIPRLLDSEQYLLEGSRGIGKTMLMKSASIHAAENYNKDSILAIWISFEESLRLERIEMNGISSLDPFLQWTMGKILLETLKAIVLAKPSCIDGLEKRLTGIFKSSSAEINYRKYSKELEDYIYLLERGGVKDSNELDQKSPSKELSSILDDPYKFKRFLLELCSEFDIQRLVFLFDEAAHVFSRSQQEKFFTLFKSLRDPQIACKAAVYPGLTNYGKSFEKGQDAKELKISWSPIEKKDIEYIKNILRSRIQGYNKEYWQKLTQNSDIINLICTCSNGNPRFSFHIIDSLENEGAFKQKAITKQMLTKSIRSVFESKWKEFNTLENRMPQYKSYIIEAEKFIKNIVVPNLRSWNSKRRENDSKLSMGFYIETSIYDRISKIFNILAYSNIINIDTSKKSIGQNYYGYYILVNPSILVTDLIIQDFSEMKKISVAIENNQAYYSSTSGIQDMIQNVGETENLICSNKECSFSTTNSTFKFCPQCASKIERSEEVSLYKILRSHSIDNLSLGIKLINRLSTRFNNIGEIQDASLDDIRMKYIQDVRIEKVKNAVTEYMSG